MATKAPNVLETLEKVVKIKDSPVDLAKIGSEWLKRIGGVKGVVERLELEYNKSKAGGLARARILDLFLRMMDKAFPDQKIADMSMLTDQDIEKRAMELMSKINGQETKTEAAADTENTGSGPVIPF